MSVDCDDGHAHSGSVRKHTSYFFYKVCWPAKDAAGGDLTKIEGAHVELLKPGACAPERVAWVPYPGQVKRIQVFADGQYAVRHVVVGSCSESEPSPWTPVSIDLTPPERPPAGEVIIPCPQ